MIDIGSNIDTCSTTWAPVDKVVEKTLQRKEIIGKDEMLTVMRQKNQSDMAGEAQYSD